MTRPSRRRRRHARPRAQPRGRGPHLADQAARGRDGARHHGRRLLRGSRGRARLRPADHAGDRYAAGGGRHPGPQPALGARRGRAHGADPDAAAARGPAGAARGAPVRRRPHRRRPGRSRARGGLARHARHRGDVRALPLRLHAPQAAHRAVHDRGRGARRAAARHRVGGRARRSRPRRLGAVRDPVPVAVAPHAGHRPALPGRLRPGRGAAAAGDRCGGARDRAADPEWLRGPAGREPAAHADRVGRRRVLRGRAAARRLFVAFGAQQALTPSPLRARRVLLASLLYLPALLALLAFDKA